VPDSYTIHLSTGPDFTDEIVIPVTNPSVTPDPTKLTIEWTTTTPLDPVKVYRWFVVGHAGGIDIGAERLPYLHNQDWWPPLSTYYRSVFRSGPECAENQIEVPTLVAPAAGETIQTLNPVLNWEVSTCWPLVFVVDISTTPTFDNPEWFVDPNVTGDYTDMTQTDYPWLNVDNILRDCTTYYWRVIGGTGQGNAADPRVWGSYSDTQTFSVSIGACPTPTPRCPHVTNYGRIDEYWPSEYTITSQAPTFTWFYSNAGEDPAKTDPWEDVCVPDSYTLHLSTGPGFTDEIVIPVTNPSVTPDPTKLTMEWTLTTPLDPVKVYRWFVVGHAGAIDISAERLPYLHNHDWWPPLSTYFRSTFRSGPECAENQIEVPTLVTPANGQTIQTINPILNWEVSTCWPLVFIVDVSTTSTFDNPEWFADPNLPGDYTDMTQTDYPWLNANNILRDCTSYYWRVIGGIGEGNAADPRVWGAYSGTRTFSVSLGACPTPTTPPQVSCADLAQAACEEKPQCVWVGGMSNFPHCEDKP
jgi:hypothetical protein